METNNQKGQRREKKPACQCSTSMKACHNIGTARLQSIAKIGTRQSTMKSSKKTVHEFSPYIPQKPSKGNFVD
jgi:hypothetical protein